jgi:hypothetical protein
VVCGKKSSKDINHLLLHCPLAMELCDFVFVPFGVKWVMPETVQGMIQSWRSSSRTFSNKVEFISIIFNVATLEGVILKKYIG